MIVNAILHLLHYLAKSNPFLVLYLCLILLYVARTLHPRQLTGIGHSLDKDMLRTPVQHSISKCPEFFAFHLDALLARLDTPTTCVRHSISKCSNFFVLFSVGVWTLSQNAWTPQEHAQQLSGKLGTQMQL